jgi:two-component system heavy metal sensor histidine kinase CusS
VSDAPPTAPDDLQVFAAAVAHELRTPLSAVAGEVELVLRRERSAAEYRDALLRIAAGINELVELSGDLTLLSDPIDTAAATCARVDAILATIHHRYHGRADVRVTSDLVGDRPVAGDETRLARAISLVMEHAIRHRRTHSPVALRARATPIGSVRLVIDAEPGGFWPHAWSSLAAAAGHSTGPLRLRTARRILEANGGALLVACPSGLDVVHIELHPPL